MDILSTLSRATRNYEPQIRAARQRMCGAAALVMAYRRCGIEADQAAIWKDVAHEFNGQFRAHTYHLANNALKQGLCATIIQTLRPWDLLQVCWQNDIAAVINHRVDPESDEGHYSLLDGVSEDSVTLNDPLKGPAISIERDRFLSLWLPNSKNSEIGGNVLIAIARHEDQPSVWSHCNQLFKDTITCTQCKHEISLKPAKALGCLNSNCQQRMWWRIFCPKCDTAIQTVE